MKGFKPTGYGPSAGFKFPASHGFTGSTGNLTNVSPYTRRLAKPHIKAIHAFADGGFVRQDNPRMQTGALDEGSPLVRRARSYTQADQESGGKTPLRVGYKRGGAAKPGYTWDMKNGGKAKKKMMKADGGPVRGTSKRGVLESLKKLPETLRDALMSPKLGSDSEKVVSGRQRQIDRAVDEMSGGDGKSNYAMGGLAKVIGKAALAAPGRMKAAPVAPPQRMAERMMTPRMPVGAMARRSKGGRAKTGMTKC